MSPEEQDGVKFAFTVDPCPYCGGTPKAEHRDGAGFRFVCSVCTERLQPWNRTLAGAALDWNTQRYRGEIIYRGRNA